MTDTDQTTDLTKCGFVGILGAPNVGKSTLLNQLAESKVSIVTHKVQTTRNTVRAIVMEKSSQIVFVDTPGIFAPKRRLDRAMVEAAWSTAGDADISVLLIDAQIGIDKEARAIIEGLKKTGAKCLAAINKIDLIERSKLLSLAKQVDEAMSFLQIFMISAQTGDGVKDLRAWLADYVPQGPWVYPEDQIADLPLRLLAAEVTREKLLLKVHDEIPYALTVETEQWTELKGNKGVRIEQIIFVKRESHRRIILGKGGSKIKEIGADSRLELQEMFDMPVHLFLFVKIRKNWEDDPERYRHLGLKMPKA